MAVSYCLGRDREVKGSQVCLEQKPLSGPPTNLIQSSLIREDCDMPIETGTTWMSKLLAVVVKNFVRLLTRRHLETLGQLAVYLMCVIGWCYCRSNRGFMKNEGVDSALMLQLLANAYSNSKLAAW